MCWQEINQYMVLNVLLLVFHFILHIIYLFDLWMNKPTYICWDTLYHIKWKGV